jgi:hypothetical protein
MTPQHHSAYEMINFTGVDDSANLIKEIQLCSKMGYSVFYAQVLHVWVTVFKLCLTNLVVNDQSSTGGVITFILGKGTRNSTIKFVTFLPKVFVLCSRLCLYFVSLFFLLMPVNDKEPEEKACSFRLLVILFPYRETIFVINLRREVSKKFLSNLIPLKVIIY